MRRRVFLGVRGSAAPGLYDDHLDRRWRRARIAASAGGDLLDARGDRSRTSSVRQDRRSTSWAGPGRSRARPSYRLARLSPRARSGCAKRCHLDRVLDLDELPVERERSARARASACTPSRSVASWPAATKWIPSSRAVCRLGSSGSPVRKRSYPSWAARIRSSPAAARADRDALDPLRAVREDERLAPADRLPDARRRAPRSRAGSRRRPPWPTLAEGPLDARRRARRRAARCCRAPGARRARGGRRAGTGRRGRAPRGGRAGAGRSTTGSLRQNMPWWTSTSWAPAAAARSKSSRELETPQAIFVTSSATDDLEARACRTPGSGRPRAARSRSATISSRGPSRRDYRYPFRARGVAQPGSALRSGRRGPEFKSPHPDYLAQGEHLRKQMLTARRPVQGRLRASTRRFCRRTPARLSCAAVALLLGDRALAWGQRSEMSP